MDADDGGLEADLGSDDADEKNMAAGAGAGKRRRVERAHDPSRDTRGVRGAGASAAALAMRAMDSDDAEGAEPPVDADEKNMTSTSRRGARVGGGGHGGGEHWHSSDTNASVWDEPAEYTEHQAAVSKAKGGEAVKRKAQDMLRVTTALAALAPHKLALQHAKEGRFAEAISLFEVSLEARPKRPKVWVNLGVTLLRKGIDDVEASRVDDAEAAFERAGRSFDTALELDPSSGKAARAKIRLAGKREQLRLVWMTLEAAGKLDPSSAGAAASLRDLNGARLKYFPAAPAGSAAPGSSTDGGTAKIQQQEGEQSAAEQMYKVGDNIPTSASCSTGKGGGGAGGAPPQKARGGGDCVYAGWWH